MENRDIHNVN